MGEPALAFALPSMVEPSSKRGVPTSLPGLGIGGGRTGVVTGVGGLSFGGGGGCSSLTISLSGHMTTSYSGPCRIHPRVAVCLLG